ncbi:MAG: DUF2971 domain-containing protein [Clostridia bacterium]|nr:DUF2971 domain-containing protein [Clostridia bacterium]
MAIKTPKTLYHYCSVDTFFNIIKNKSIWLSDVRQSNDELEIAYMKNKFSEHVKNAAFIFQFIHLSKHEEFDSLLLNAIVETYCETNTLSKNWVFCLSEQGDLLSQWRGYADDGYGISIGFDSEQLRLILDKIDRITDAKNKRYGSVTLRKVNYSEKKMHAKLEECIDSNEIGKSNTIKEFREKLLPALIDVELHSPTYKAPSFKEEKEWRIVLNILYNPNHENTPINIDDESCFLGNFAYTPSKRRLVSHYELSFKDFKPLIRKIILGPKCKVSPEEMRRFLCSCKLLDNSEDERIKIEKSSSSYR